MLTIPCKGCGATLPVALDTESVTCLFCNEQTVVPQDRRRQLHTIRRVTVKSGLDALERAHLKTFKPGPGDALMVLGASSTVTVLAFIVMGMLAKLADAGLIVFALGLLTLMGLVGLMLGWLLYRAVTAQSRADRLVASIRKAASRGPGKGSCPQCGADVQIPTAATEMSCIACDANLLVSDGMLVKRVANSKAQSKLWTAQAHTVFSEAALKHQKRLKFWTVGVAGFPLLLMVLATVCSGVLSAVVG